MFKYIPRAYLGTPTKPLINLTPERRKTLFDKNISFSSSFVFLKPP